MFCVLSWLFYWIDWMAASTRIGSGGVQFPGPVVLDHEYSRCCLRTAFYWVPSWISVARSVRPRHGKRYYYYPWGPECLWFWFMAWAIMNRIQYTNTSVQINSKLVHRKIILLARTESRTPRWHFELFIKFSLSSRCFLLYYQGIKQAL